MDRIKYILTAIITGFLFNGCYTQLSMFHQPDNYAAEYYQPEYDRADLDYILDTMFVEGEEDLYVTQYELPQEEYNYYYTNFYDPWYDWSYYTYSPYYNPWYDWPYYGYGYWPPRYPGYWGGCCTGCIYVGYYPPYYPGWWYDSHHYGWGGGGGSYTRSVTPRPFTKGGHLTRGGSSTRVRIGATGVKSRSSDNNINSRHTKRKKSARTTLVDNSSSGGTSRPVTTIRRTTKTSSSTNSGTKRTSVSRISPKKERKYHTLIPRTTSSNKGPSSSGTRKSYSSPKRSNSSSSSSGSNRSTYRSSSSNKSSSSYTGSRSSSSSSGSSRSVSSGRSSSSSSSKSGSSKSGSGSRSSRRR